MSNSRVITARRIAELVGGSLEGDPDASVHWIAPVDTAGEGELTFAADEKYAARLADSKASVALVGEKPETAPMTLVRVGNVNAAVAALLAELAPRESMPPAGVHPSAVVAEDATVDPAAAVGPHVVIGAGSSVGAGTILQAGVVLGEAVTVGAGCVPHENVVVKDRCRLGSRVVVGPGSVVGFTGFGYFTDPSTGVHHLVPHAGDVVIEDDVEIGACSCVDRAKFGSTRIGAGTKIDNLVQVAHNVQVGKGCLLVGQCGIAGSAVLGNHVVL
ncbi:MAG: UDP-3-O-(3-hydroxymyristoyl)glucosamine N-acyltransferase, partial [Phycisphaerae bacterium]